MTKKKNNKIDRFIVTGAAVTILVSQIIDGKPGPRNGIGPIMIPRSNWKMTEKILEDNIKELCKKNEIKEVSLIS